MKKENRISIAFKLKSKSRTGVVFSLTNLILILPNFYKIGEKGKDGYGMEWLFIDICYKRRMYIFW